MFDLCDMLMAVMLSCVISFTASYLLSVEQNERAIARAKRLEGRRVRRQLSKYRY